MKTLRVSVTIVLSLVLGSLALRWDRARLTDDQRARAWGRTSWEDALHWCVYALNTHPLFPILGWVWVTRQDVQAWKRRGWGVVLLRSLGVLGLGVIAMVLLAVPIVGVDELLRVLSGSPD
jgi:hypothetical protein